MCRFGRGWPGLCSGLWCAALMLGGCSPSPDGDRAVSDDGGPSPMASANEDPMVGYDMRTLRPTDEPLAEMFDRTFDAARKEGKRVAVLFSADWCEPCKILEVELGNMHPASTIGDVRIVVLKEEPWEGATRMDEYNALRNRWHPTINSYPVMVLLDDRGEKLEEMKEAKERLEAEGVAPTLPNWFVSRAPNAGDGAGPGA